MAVQRSVEDQFWKSAYSATRDSNCRRRTTGAVLILNGQEVLVATNGTPLGMTRCDQGGCPRCASDIPQLQGYEDCACVHAEVGLIAQAARGGIRTDEGSVYCTLRPCIGCLKVLIEAGIHLVAFSETYEFPPEIETLWKKMANQSGIRTIDHTRT